MNKNQKKNHDKKRQVKEGVKTFILLVFFDAKLSFLMLCI